MNKDKVFKQIDKRLDGYRQRISELEEIRVMLTDLDDPIFTLPIEEVDIDTVLAWDEVTLEIHMPWVVEQIPAHRELLEGCGWVHYRDFEILNIERRYVQFTHPDIAFDLELTYDAKLPGASCKIVKIDEKKVRKTVTEPVYEVICPEGAEENVFAEAQ